MHLMHTGEWRFEKNDLVITLRSEYGGDDNDGDYYAADTEWRIPLAELAEALRKATQDAVQRAEASGATIDTKSD